MFILVQIFVSIIKYLGKSKIQNFMAKPKKIIQLNVFN